MATTAELFAEVAAVKTAGESAIALLNGLKAQLDDAIANKGVLSQADVDTIFADLTSDEQALKDAVTANTPAS